MNLEAKDKRAEWCTKGRGHTPDMLFALLSLSLGLQTRQFGALHLFAQRLLPPLELLLPAHEVLAPLVLVERRRVRLTRRRGRRRADPLHVGVRARLRAHRRRHELRRQLRRKTLSRLHHFHQMHRQAVLVARQLPVSIHIRERPIAHMCNTLKLINAPPQPLAANVQYVIRVLVCTSLRRSNFEYAHVLINAVAMLLFGISERDK